jgi:tRNA(Ile)-lysidine synthase
MQSSTAAASTGALQPAQLWQRLRQLAPASLPLHCAVAWSGGLDSTVLLHQMAALRRAHPRHLRLRALHVDHHLQAASALFRAHCQDLARRWRIALTVLDANVDTSRGASIEEAAREARYACWREVLQPGELLLTAQHADDQLETALLALLRGAGPAGLAAMPAVATLGRGLLLRPLLSITRAELASYAASRKLPLVEDPSNAELRFDRNFLRLQVLPLLRQRWPGAASTVSRSAGHCAVAALQLARQAADDLQAAADGPDLDMAVLRRWTPERAQSVLRAWFARHGLRSPETRHLREILRMLEARPDAQPRLDLPLARVRAHAGRLILQPLSTPDAAVPAGPVKWVWRRGALQLPGGGTLAVVPDAHGDLDITSLPQALIVHYLDTLPSKGRSLRKRLQALEVPLWERGSVPLVCEAADRPGALLAIGDLWLHERLCGRKDGRRGRIVWQGRR